MMERAVTLQLEDPGSKAQFYMHEQLSLLGLSLLIYTVE